MRTLLVLTIAGMVIGVMGDVATGIDFSAGDLAIAVLLSPLLVVVGGGVVSDLFLIGGLLFWPVWGLLAWRWMKTRKPLVAMLILAWSAQGFFKLVHRFGMLMSA